VVTRQSHPPQPGSPARGAFIGCKGDLDFPIIQGVELEGEKQDFGADGRGLGAHVGLELARILARQDIDLLGLLEEKTKGNLTGEEERLMEQALCDLRMRYVEVTRG